MERIKEPFLEKIQSILSLAGKHILEIGCGKGEKTSILANIVGKVDAIDPDADALAQARANNKYSHVTFAQASAEQLPFPDRIFDVAIFMLSFHHVLPENMDKALSEALRVTKPSGNIIILEPGAHGTLFQAEKQFGAGDGDERKAKTLAYVAMLNYPRFVEVAELWDETIFHFDSLDDFLSSMSPTSSDHKAIKEFLEGNNFLLSAERRIKHLSTGEIGCKKQPFLS